MEINISLEDRKVRKKLNTISGGLRSYKKPFELVGDDIVDYTTNKVFKSQGKALGEPWKKLSAATLKMRRNRTGYYKKTPVATGKILIWTGRLVNSFRKRASRMRLVVDNTAEHFKYHQPTQRKMLGINKEIIEIVVKRINEHIRNLFT